MIHFAELIEGALRRADGPVSKEELQETTALASQDLRDGLDYLRRERRLHESDEGYEVRMEEDVSPMPMPADAVSDVPVAAGPDRELDDTPGPGVLDSEVVEAAAGVLAGSADEYVARIVLEVRFEARPGAMPPVVLGVERESLGLDAVAIETAGVVREHAVDGIREWAHDMHVSSSVESVEAVTRRRVLP